MTALIRTEPPWDDPAEDRCTERCGRLAAVDVLVGMSTLSTDEDHCTFRIERRCARHTRG